jgi:hypothetical protein
MKNYNETKSLALGMSFSKARQQLNRKIIFYLLQKYGLDICFRCKKKIKNIIDFSIEHKIAWQHSNNPKNTYFDMKNINFSHIVCNSSARKQTKSIANISGFKGVIKDSGKDLKRKKIWRAMISIKNRRVTIGRYYTSEEAARAYDTEVVKIFGKNTITNKSLGLL